MRRLLFVLSFFFAGTGFSNAWYADVQGPDVFGLTRVAALDDSFGQSLLLDCDTDKNANFGILFEKKEFQEINSASATLFLQVDNGDVIKFPAERRDWNNNYFGILITDAAEELPMLTTLFSGAKSKVNVGIEFLGDRVSMSFGVRGSTKAMDKVYTHCGPAFDNLKKP